MPKNIIREMREEAGFTKVKFCEYFGIPYRTVQHWEGGTRDCPVYLAELIRYKLENEKLIAPKE